MKPLTIAILTGAAMFCGCAEQSAPASDAATPTRQPSTSAAVAADSAERLVIEFAPNSSSLSNEAVSKLDQAGRLYRDANPFAMTVAGHSDPSGSEFNNLLLSARRAAIVKEGLVDRGIPAQRLQIVAYGQSLLPPGDTPQRVATITWK